MKAKYGGSWGRGLDRPAETRSRARCREAMEVTRNNRGQSHARDDGTAAAGACHRQQRLDDRPTRGRPARRRAFDGGPSSPAVVARVRAGSSPTATACRLVVGRLRYQSPRRRTHGSQPVRTCRCGQERPPTAINAQEIDVVAALASWISSRTIWRTESRSRIRRRDVLNHGVPVSPRGHHRTRATTSFPEWRAAGNRR